MQWRLACITIFISRCLQKDQSSVSVTCICAARIATSSFLGNESDYILVADSLCNLYVIQNGQVRRIIKLPSVVTSVGASALCRQPGLGYVLCC